MGIFLQIPFRTENLYAFIFCPFNATGRSCIIPFQSNRSEILRRSERSSFLSRIWQQDRYSTNVCVAPNEMKIFATAYEEGDHLPELVSSSIAEGIGEHFIRPLSI